MRPRYRRTWLLRFFVVVPAVEAPGARLSNPDAGFVKAENFCNGWGWMLESVEVEEIGVCFREFCVKIGIALFIIENGMYVSIHREGVQVLRLATPRRALQNVVTFTVRFRAWHQHNVRLWAGACLRSWNNSCTCSGRCRPAHAI